VSQQRWLPCRSRRRSMAVSTTHDSKQALIAYQFSLLFTLNSRVQINTALSTPVAPEFQFAGVYDIYVPDTALLEWISTTPYNVVSYVNHAQIHRRLLYGARLQPKAEKTIAVQAECHLIKGETPVLWCTILENFVQNLSKNCNFVTHYGPCTNNVGTSNQGCTDEA